MARWLKYFKQRFSPLPQLALIGGMSSIASPSGWRGIAVAFAGLFLFFFLLRAMDEYKDYEKDCIAHPDRPLPAGLISKEEMKRAIGWLLVAMGVYGIAAMPLWSLSAGIWYLIAMGYLWAMFHEFWIGRHLSKRPLAYALSHQAIVLPLSAFLTAGMSANTLPVAMVLLGGFFTYEICRKLDPKAHAILKTYPQMYGRAKTVFFAACSIALSSLFGYVLGLEKILGPAAVLLAALLFFYLCNPKRFKLVEAAASGYLLACIYALGIGGWT